MVKRALPESEESKREKYARWITRAAWIGVVFVGVLLTLYFLLGGS